MRAVVEHPCSLALTRPGPNPQSRRAAPEVACDPYGGTARIGSHDDRPLPAVGRIGTGGMGVVYLVVGPDGNQAALKLIRSELADDPAFRARFRREVEAGQRVGGVCNAKYLDADLDAERPYLVTEYVPGGNLADFVAANGPLPGDQAVSLAVGLAEALVAMSSVGVIHRDLKPSNVLMGATGPKVVDFGIVHAADGTALTQTGLTIGSPSWMAPEQATGQSGSAATDVFSWGATVAFANTGRSPFGEGRPDAVLYRVVHEPPDLVGLDPRLEPLVRQALEKDPARRPTPDDLLLGLVRTAMPGCGPGGRRRRHDHRRPRPHLASGHASVPPPVRPPPGTVGPPAPDEEPGGRRKLWWLGVAAFVLVAALIAGGIALATQVQQQAGELDDDHRGEVDCDDDHRRLWGDDHVNHCCAAGHGLGPALAGRLPHDVRGAADEHPQLAVDGGEVGSLRLGEPDRRLHRCPGGHADPRPHRLGVFCHHRRPMAAAMLQPSRRASPIPRPTAPLPAPVSRSSAVRQAPVRVATTHRPRRCSPRQRLSAPSTTRESPRHALGPIPGSRSTRSAMGSSGSWTHRGSRARAPAPVAPTRRTAS